MKKTTLTAIATIIFLAGCSEAKREQHTSRYFMEHEEEAKAIQVKCDALDKVSEKREMAELECAYVEGALHALARERGEGPVHKNIQPWKGTAGVPK